MKLDYKPILRRKPSNLLLLVKPACISLLIIFLAVFISIQAKHKLTQPLPQKQKIIHIPIQQSSKQKNNNDVVIGTAQKNSKVATIIIPSKEQQPISKNTNTHLHIKHVAYTPKHPIQHEKANIRKGKTQTHYVDKPVDWSDITIKPGDNLSHIFERNQIPAITTYELLALKNFHKYLTKLKPGNTLRINKNKAGELNALELSIAPTEVLQIKRKQNKFKAKIIKLPIKIKTILSEGTINNSLFLAGQRAGLSDKTIMQMANIFGWDIDFALDIRPNDSFKVIYQQYYLDGKLLETGPILATEFTNRGHTYRALRYPGDSNSANYYTPKGKSMRKAFIRTPVKFSRISSHFTLGRKHPILHKIRAHRGVDYAAPRGTPVKASGDGKVIFIGQKGGYGNAVILQHGKKYSTLYGHLSRFNKKLKKGSKVKQGQVIAYVGMTGLATGPHLHYEFRINGVHRNPLTVPLPKASPISENLIAKFSIHAKKLIALLNAKPGILLASISAENEKVAN